MKYYSTLLLLLFIGIKAQKNEIVVQTNYATIGLSYEYFLQNHFSLGTAVGTGLFAIKKKETPFMSDYEQIRKNNTSFYIAPFIRYYFTNDYKSFFLMTEFHVSKVNSTIYRNGIENKKLEKTYLGPFLGVGYKFKLKQKFSVNLYVAAGYDLKENSLIPIIADSMVSFGCQF